jgi:hypothetical protein
MEILVGLERTKTKLLLWKIGGMASFPPPAGRPKRAQMLAFSAVRRIIVTKFRFWGMEASGH